MTEFEIANVQVYAQYGASRVTSVPIGASFEIHADYDIRNLLAGFTGWSTAMTVYSNSQLEQVGADIFGDHFFSGWKDAHDAINVVKPAGRTYYLVQIFANQAHGAGAPPGDMWSSSSYVSDPSWVRLWWGILLVDEGAGAVFSGEIASVSPTSLRVGQPLQLTIAYSGRTSSAVEAITGWYAEAKVTIGGVTKSGQSGFHFGYDGSGNLSVNFGTMPTSPIDGQIVLRLHRGGFSTYYEDVDSSPFQILVAEEPPPPPPPPPPPGTANIYGQVKDANNGVVIASVRVTAVGKTAYTNTSGNYTVGGITPGSYQVTFAKSGYQTLVQPAEVLEGNNRLDVLLTKSTTPPPDGGGGESPSWLLPVAIAAGLALVLLPERKKPAKKR